MRPCNKEFRIVKTPAGKSWEAAVKHRIYSCPDTSAYERVIGASCLLLTNKRGARRFFDVEAVELCDLRVSNFLKTVPEKFHQRLRDYKKTVESIPDILDGKWNYRFYFLSEEPWTEWLQELVARASDSEWEAILLLCTGPSAFFAWPQEGTLLWPGFTRGDDNQVHSYPLALEQQLTRLGLRSDTRNNGPAIMSFLATGGRRPNSGGEGWPIHHIYDGKGKVTGGPKNVLHAVRSPEHFTHSAGLVAAHPEAHELAHKSDLLRWLLRREAFLRFGYDPMRAFSRQ
jgi:hypothetical protein